MVAVASVGIVGLARRSRRPASCPRTTRAHCSSWCRLPGGASVARTSEVVRQAEEILTRGRGGRRLHLGHRIELHRQLFAAERRLHGRHAQAVRGAQGPLARGAGADRAARHQVPQIQGGTVVPLAPPPILGLGTGGGFTYVLQDLRGGDPKALAQALRGLIVAANQDPKLTRVFSTFSAREPVDLSRYRSRQGAGPRRAAERRIPGACRRRWAATTSTT